MEKAQVRDVNPTLRIIILTVTGFTTPIKRQILAKIILKT